MIKLVDLLTEKIIKIPQSQLLKADSAFSYIKKNADSLKKKSPKSYIQDPYIPKSFKNIFNIEDLRGNLISISLGLYNDPKDNAYARMDQQNRAVIVNISKLTDEYNFVTSIEHELVHAIDPKAYDAELDAKLGVRAPKAPSKNASPDKIEQYEKDLIAHLNSPAEFDAHTSTLINTIASGLAKKDKDKVAMSTVKSQLFKALSDIKTKSYDEVYNKYKNTAVPFLFLRGPWIKDRIETARDNFYSELVKIKAWSTDEQLYKRFLKILSIEL